MHSVGSDWQTFLPGGGEQISVGFWVSVPIPQGPEDVRNASLLGQDSFGPCQASGQCPCLSRPLQDPWQ